MNKAKLLLGFYRVHSDDLNKWTTPVLWPPHAKSWVIGKDSDAGRNWGQEEKGTTEDEMAGLHHWLNGRESEWTPGVGDGQRGLVCCDSWSRKESDMTEQLNWTELIEFYFTHGTPDPHKHGTKSWQEHRLRIRMYPQQFVEQQPTSLSPNMVYQRDQLASCWQADYSEHLCYEGGHDLPLWKRKLFWIKIFFPS